MKTKTTKMLWALSLPVILLASCGNSEDDKWSYSRNDMADFIKIDAEFETKEDGTATLAAISNDSIFTTDLSKSDVIVYDIDQAIKKLSESNKDYADYSILKEASTNVTNVQTSEGKDGFEVTFLLNEGENYGMLINSSVVVNSKYLMVSPAEKKDFDGNSDPQSDFEESYVTKGITWGDGGQFAYQIISNIGTIIVGGVTDNPCSIASGIFGLLGTLSQSLMPGGPTMQDIMDQLKETDRKIDALSDKIDRNTQQLADEIVRAEAMVDQANLNTLNIAINDFATNCLAPINNFNRNLADEVGFYYRDYVTETQTIDLYLFKNDDGEWESTPLGEMNGNTNFSLTIANFDNARDHLSKHGNIVEEGFMEELDKDVDKAIALKTDLPEGIDKDNLRQFVTSMIYEKFSKQYFSSNVTKAQDYRDQMITCAQRISGTGGMISILNSYLSRLQYMYNFAGEIKDNIRTLSANILKFLDMNTARASQASMFAGITSKEMENNYKTAREAIQNFYKNVKELPDTYSFTSAATLHGGWYRSAYSISYDNPGNHCTLNVKFNFQSLEMYGITIDYTDDNLSDHLTLSSIQHARIATRWGLLRSSGVIDSDSDYIHYLNDVGVINDAAMKAAQTCFNWHHAFDECYRILTSDRAERELNSDDTSTWMVCVAQGNPKGDYFDLDYGYGYREKWDKSCWYGRTFEGTFVNAATGGAAGNQRILTWARYAESHWYWTNDEYWAFKTFDNTGYFFSIDVVTE